MSFTLDYIVLLNDSFERKYIYRFGVSYILLTALFKSTVSIIFLYYHNLLKMILCL